MVSGLITLAAGWASGVLSAAGYLPYLWGLLLKRTSPSPVAWLVWSAEYGVLFAALARQGPVSMLWLPGGQLAGSLVAFMLALRLREPGMDWKRLAIPAGSCTVALATWGIVSSPLAAVAILVAVEAYGMRITIARVWRWPVTEPAWAWVLWTGAGLAGLAAALGGPLTSCIYPGTFAVLGASVLIAQDLGWMRNRRGRHAARRPAGLWPGAGTRHLATRSRVAARPPGEGLPHSQVRILNSCEVPGAASAAPRSSAGFPGSPATRPGHPSG